VLHAAGQLLAGKSVERHNRGLADGHLRDVGLVEPDLDDQRPEVRQDGDRLPTRHPLAAVERELGDGAVDRGNQLGLVQGTLGRGEPEPGVGEREVGLIDLQLSPGDLVCGGRGLLTPERVLRVDHLAPGAAERSVADAGSLEVIVGLGDLEALPGVGQPVRRHLALILEDRLAAAVAQLPLAARVEGTPIGFLGVGELALGLGELDPGRGELVAGVAGQGAGTVVVGLGCGEACLRQRHGVGIRRPTGQIVEAHPGRGQRDLGLPHLELRLLEGALRIGRIEPCQDIAGADDIALLDEHLGDAPAGLRRYGHLAQRRQAAAAVDRHAHRAALGGRYLGRAATIHPTPAAHPVGAPDKLQPSEARGDRGDDPKQNPPASLHLLPP